MIEHTKFIFFWKRQLGNFSAIKQADLPLHKLGEVYIFLSSTDMSQTPSFQFLLRTEHKGNCCVHMIKHMNIYKANRYKTKIHNLNNKTSKYIETIVTFNQKYIWYTPPEMEREKSVLNSAQTWKTGLITVLEIFSELFPI